MIRLSQNYESEHRTEVADELLEMLDEAEESLEKTVGILQEIKMVANRNSVGESGMLGSRMDSYIIPHLESWLGGREISSIGDIREEIETWRDEEPEEGEE